jgi:hypothetical protein
MKNMVPTNPAKAEMTEKNKITTSTYKGLVELLIKKAENYFWSETHIKALSNFNSAVFQAMREDNSCEALRLIQDSLRLIIEIISDSSSPPFFAASTSSSSSSSTSSTTTPAHPFLNQYKHYLNKVEQHISRLSSNITISISNPSANNHSTYSSFTTTSLSSSMTSASSSLSNGAAAKKREEQAKEGFNKVQDSVLEDRLQKGIKWAIKGEYKEAKKHLDRTYNRLEYRGKGLFTRGLISKLFGKRSFALKNFINAKTEGYEHPNLSLHIEDCRMRKKNTDSGQDKANALEDLKNFLNSPVEESLSLHSSSSSSSNSDLSSVTSSAKQSSIIEQESYILLSKDSTSHKPSTLYEAINLVLNNKTMKEVNKCLSEIIEGEKIDQGELSYIKGLSYIYRKDYPYALNNFKKAKEEGYKHDNLLKYIEYCYDGGKYNEVGALTSTLAFDDLKAFQKKFYSPESIDNSDSNQNNSSVSAKKFSPNSINKKPKIFAYINHIQNAIKSALDGYRIKAFICIGNATNNLPQSLDQEERARAYYIKGLIYKLFQDYKNAQTNFEKAEKKGYKHRNLQNHIEDCVHKGSDKANAQEDLKSFLDTSIHESLSSSSSNSDLSSITSSAEPLTRTVQDSDIALSLLNLHNSTNKNPNSKKRGNGEEEHGAGTKIAKKVTPKQNAVMDTDSEFTILSSASSSSSSSSSSQSPANKESETSTSSAVSMLLSSSRNNNPVTTESSNRPTAHAAREESRRKNNLRSNRLGKTS